MVKSKTLETCEKIAEIYTSEINKVFLNFRKETIKNKINKSLNEKLK